MLAAPNTEASLGSHQKTAQLRTTHCQVGGGGVQHWRTSCSQAIHAAKNKQQGVSFNDKVAVSNKMQLRVWINFSTESTKKLKKFVSNSAVIWRATFRNDESSTLQKKKRQNPSCIEKGSQEYFSTGCCQIKKASLGNCGFTSLLWFLKNWQAENIGAHLHSWGKISDT